MRFDFTDDQKALHAGARALFAGECTPKHVRAAWESDSGRDLDRWRAMAATGLVGLTVPEEHGGLGLGEVDLVLILEEAGRVLLPEPLVETTAVAVPLLLEAGSDEQQAEWLPRIAAGEAVVAVALTPPAPEAAAPRPLPVADAGTADLLLLQTGDELHAVPRERFHATAQPSFDGARRLFAVEAETDASARMPGGMDAVAKAFDRAAAATAAVLTGIAGRMVELTVAYAKERSQFDRPVGSFQAVKHLLADAFLGAESSRAAAWYAAYAIAHDADDRSEAASVAKSYASDAERLANDVALQVHAGIGFTWEHDLHLWLKRGKALEQAYGSATWHRRRIAESLFAVEG